MTRDLCDDTSGTSTSKTARHRWSRSPPCSPDAGLGASLHARVSSPAPRSTTCQSPVWYVVGSCPPPSSASSTASSKKRVRMAMRPLSPFRARTRATASGPASAAANGSSNSGLRASSSSDRSAAMDLELSDTAAGSVRWTPLGDASGERARAARDIFSTAVSREVLVGAPSTDGWGASASFPRRRRPFLPRPRLPLSGLSPPRLRLRARMARPPSCRTRGQARCARYTNAAPITSFRATCCDLVVATDGAFFSSSSRRRRLSVRAPFSTFSTSLAASRRPNLGMAPRASPPPRRGTRFGRSPPFSVHQAAVDDRLEASQIQFEYL